MVRGINKALETLTERLRKKAGAVLQDCLSSGCQHLNHHTSASVNIGLYSSFLTIFLYLLPCGLCLLACSTNACTLCFSCAHVPEGWAAKTFVIWDNFVLNISYIWFLLLILTDISISVLPYLLRSCFSDWQSC